MAHYQPVHGAACDCIVATLVSAHQDLLTTDDMAALTDAKLRGRQIEVLNENRIPYVLSAAGWPKTTWSAINSRLSSGTKTTKTKVGINLGS
jgi:hypothetical protein